tara:strand:- start:2979 stop:3194 length:216 start_codon:yes stop_codon:yes gene_type:complete
MNPEDSDPSSSIDIITVYFLRVLSPEGKFVKELDCGTRFEDAARIMQNYLGEGKIAIIKKELTSYNDYIPF